jgi:hypothetical protein
MKVRAIISLLIFLIFILFFSIAHSGERPKDFRGIVWGTHISKVPGLVLVERGKTTTKIYSRPTDSLKIGAAQVDAIKYSFKEDKLVGVTIYFKTFSQLRKIKPVFWDLYGPPNEKKDYPKASYYFWRANMDDEANIKLHWFDDWSLDEFKGSISIDWKNAEKQRSGL